MSGQDILFILAVCVGAVTILLGLATLIGGRDR